MQPSSQPFPEVTGRAAVPGRVAVVGAGIVGLAHAWAAARRGHDVAVFERDPRAAGASIRNFGMVWPMGQPVGDRLDLALRSRERWLALAAESGIPVHGRGSLHLAHAADEMAVLEEFHAREAGLRPECRLLSASAVLALAPGANPAGLRGGLFSGTELGVDPRHTIRALPGWLTTRHGVRFTFGTPVLAIDDRTLVGPRGALGRFDRVVVCPGADLAALCPDLAAGATPGDGLRRCKLQMLALRAPAGGWRIGPHLAGGLTLRHYEAFAGCGSLPALRARIARDTPELDRFGIHVMAAQLDSGAIIVGDSHEYDDAIEPFDREEIDDLILRELRRILALPDWSIVERWHGCYGAVRRADGCRVALETDLRPGVHVCTGTGGAGMTLAFGIAERAWDHWSGPT
jgi:FAD dependent oxidoreductase TIGR03364